ncbi:MAG: lysylphosphatidylglycerol synthase transmembrane domain-containing protein [Candidatus Nanopelagicales bacterium]
MIERPTNQVAPDQPPPPEPRLIDHPSSAPTHQTRAASAPAHETRETSAPAHETREIPEASAPAPALAPSPTTTHGAPEADQEPPIPLRPRSTPAKPQHTLVVEEGIFPSRLRRPRDLLGAGLALAGAVLVVIVAVAAEQTVIAIDDDLASAQNSLPDLIWGGLSSLAGLGLVLLPLVASVSLLLRRRGRQLLEAIAALTAAAIALTLISAAVREFGSQTLYFALTGSSVNDDLAYPTNPLLGALVAFIVVARLMSRPRWNVLIAVMVATAMVVGSVGSGSTSTAQGLSFLVGLAIGLLTRYLLGTPTTRPAGSEVAGTLLNAGIPLVMLRARAGTDSGRHYMAVRADGGHLDVVVLDRDLEGSGVASALWRTIRLRESNDSASGLSMGGQVERASMMSYAAEVAGVPSPRLTLAAMVSADSALLAYESADGRYVAPGSGTTSDRPTTEELETAWRAVSAMQARFLAHQNLNAAHVRYAGSDTHLTGMESGTVAAGDVVLRLDIAELLVTQALQTDPATAVAAARGVLGDEEVLRGLPVLQRVAFSGPTRTALRADKTLLNALREELLAINPAVDMAPIDLERLKPRTVITLVLGTVAAYLLLSQLAQVNVTEVLAEADWRWAAVALALSMTTYIGATLSLSGFVPDRLSFLRTMQAQFAASFATLVSPPTLGAVAVNARYLNRSGLPPAAAAATVGVAQVAAFIVHVGLLLLFGIAAGTQSDLQFNPPRAVIIGVGVLALVIGGLASLSRVRHWLANRIRPMAEQVIPRLATVAQRPAKLVEGFGGILLLNLAYCLCLVAAVRAFSDSLTIAAICFVYLAGSTLGQAAPTPGGLGVVEAALAAGLTAAGMNSALAVSATLLFRTVTFWLPTVPGWFAFRNLTNKGLL